MPLPLDLPRLTSTVSVTVLATVMVGTGTLTLLSRTDWWCEQRAHGDVEALRAVARTQFPDAVLHPTPRVTCRGGVHATVWTTVPDTSTGQVHRELRQAGWTQDGVVRHSPDGRVQATASETETGTRVRLSSHSD